MGATLSELLNQYGDHLPLDQGAALLAADEQPGTDPKETLAALDALAAGVRMPPGCEGVEAVARLHHHLFEELGFGGDAETYDDPRNSCLDRVIERRRGLPITLSVLYVEVARRVGLLVDPVGFPQHFLVRPHGLERAFVDPFHGGRILHEAELRGWLDRQGVAPAERDALLGPLCARRVLWRMTLNLWTSYKRREDRDGLLRSLRRLRVLAVPGSDEARSVDNELRRLEREI